MISTVSSLVYAQPFKSSLQTTDSTNKAILYICFDNHQTTKAHQQLLTSIPTPVKAVSSNSRPSFTTLVAAAQILSVFVKNRAERTSPWAPRFQNELQFQ